MTRRDTPAERRRKTTEAARNEYDARLMAALEFATERRWELSARNGMLVIDAPRGEPFEGEPYVLPVVWPGESVLDLELLEHQIETERAAAAEADRRSALRESARAKLTDDEARAAGLIR